VYIYVWVLPAKPKRAMSFKNRARLLKVNMLDVPFALKLHNFKLLAAKKSNNERALNLMKCFPKDKGIHCPACGLNKPLYAYKANIRSYYGFKFTKCILCYDDLQCPFRKIVSNTRACTIKRNKAGLNHDKPNIDVAFLRDLLEKQNGRCAYSNLKLAPQNRGANPFNMSLERVDNSIGYIKTNVVFICAFLQFGNGGCFDKQSTKDLLLYQAKNDSFIFCEKAFREQVENPNSAVRHYICNCMVKTCQNSARRRSKNERRSDSSGVCAKDIFDVIVEQIIVQKGRCILTERPFVYLPHNPHSPSRDRLDDSLGYVKGNLQLIALPLNTPKKPANKVFHDLRKAYFEKDHI
jgi:hypothetical protein